MIVVTRLNDSRFAVNPDLVERIQESPDTTLIMVDGAKYIVTETMAEVIDLIAQYRARIVSLAYSEPDVASASGAGHFAAPGMTGPQPVLAPVAELSDVRDAARDAADGRS
ncbi:flagellar FlbD family protein [Curtobacterium sp. RRHDQ10]|uniref:flagellar FlbD family protein n=1 Tax=Curtobacterium phyllosphaerae TaxID=3413379 RepID=UPI003BF27AD5